jgi:hypothetical protein
LALQVLQANQVLLGDQETLDRLVYKAKLVAEVSRVIGVKLASQGLRYEKVSERYLTICLIKDVA